MSNDREWVVALTRATSKGGTIAVTIPAEVGRSLQERGLNAARLRITNEGLLFMPFKREHIRPGQKNRPSVELPDSWGQE